jgi:hypothetical protein
MGLSITQPFNILSSFEMSSLRNSAVLFRLARVRGAEITNIPQRRKRQRPRNAEPQLGFFTFNRLAACRAKLGLGVPETCILL